MSAIETEAVETASEDSLEDEAKVDQQESSHRPRIGNREKAVRGIHRGRGQRVAGEPRQWIPVVLVVLALALWGAPRLATGVQEALGIPVDVSLPPCVNGQPQLVIPVFDLSSSVIDSGGADPGGRSFDEAVAVARAMRDMPCSPDDRVGAVLFADAAVEVPPVLVHSMSVIEKTFERPPSDEIGAGTDIAEALERVQEVIARHPQLSPTVVVFSDMEDEDSAIGGQLSAIGRDRVHLIALGDHNSMHDGSFASVTELDDVGRGDVAAALVDVLVGVR